MQNPEKHYGLQNVESVVLVARRVVRCGSSQQIKDKTGVNEEVGVWQRRFRQNARKFVFSNRVIDSWNSLPIQCVNCNTVDTFKNLNCTGIGNRRD